LVRFELPQGFAQLSLDWRPGSLFLRAAVSGLVVKEHRFTWIVPTPGRERVHMNLWLYRGAPPAIGRPIEVIVEGFGFVPALASAR
jgi:hypothetical protein